MNRSTKTPGIFCHDRIEMAAFVVDRAIVEIAHLADRLRQTAERRDLGPAGVLLDPHALEVRIAVDIGARRPLPATAKSRKSRLEIEKEGIALLLPVIANVDAGVVLLAHDRPHRFASGPINFGRIDRVAPCAQGVEPRQVAWPRQAAGMSRQYSRNAALHRFGLLISTHGKAAKERGPATISPAQAPRTWSDGTEWCRGSLRSVCRPRCFV